MKICYLKNSNGKKKRKKLRRGRIRVLNFLALCYASGNRSSKSIKIVRTLHFSLNVFLSHIEFVDKKEGSATDLQSSTN